MPDVAPRSPRLTGVFPSPLLLLPSLLLVAGGPSPALAQTSSDQPDEAEAQEVLEVVRSFNRAFAENDPDRYFTFIDDAITVFTPSNPYRVEGMRHDREEFEWSLAEGRSRVGYFQELQPRVRVHGGVAVVTYHSRGSYGPEGRVAYLKETDVLVKRDGRWRIIHIHVSSTPS